MSATSRNMNESAFHLSATREILESVIDQIEDGIIIALPDGKITYYNRMVKELFGLLDEATPRALNELGNINWSKRMTRAALDSGEQYGIAKSSDR